MNYTHKTIIRYINMNTNENIQNANREKLE